MDMFKKYTNDMIRRALVGSNRRASGVVGSAIKLKDRVMAKVVRRSGTKDGIRLIGRVKVYHIDRAGRSEFVGRGENEVVTAGLNAIVDAFQGSANTINDFHYVGFGTNSASTTAGMTDLTSEVTGGSYARLNCSQGEGSQTYIYQIGETTWTNASGASQNIKEYGCFSSTTGGTLLARISLNDPDGISAKNVAPSEQLKVTWTWALADA